ncbi:hypothetical protein ILUMI_23090 [Ignelater luminosus]|uniref:RNA helicase n=1 Tax=Ignelater luminosus TaxID=2038154 RepID=A0A8K0FZX4_IGNLU|nr:hypothetical protein ILUMI_23090 [Ignelater luminosus]
MLELPGFGEPAEGEDDSQKKVVKPSKKSGGFQSMGLSFTVLKGITKRGYKIPTPIQRKTIPIALESRDVVAMARTGSGKTACFLIPLFEKLKLRSAKAGARALILSPTRELALQTLKFIKELGRFTDLKSAVILGGDSMESQFSVIHGNPDILVATPGRFLHVCIEMDLKLSSIEYVVFDEADRLFEMGFGEQLNNIVQRLPDVRQTLLFSATLPKVLVEFAKAGLDNPVLIRLDVESKLPSELELVFITVRPEEQVAALLVLLKSHIDLNQQTVVFAATKHHVEYLHMILDYSGITNTYIYSNLDPSARKIHAAKFRQKKASVLVVTDVAARGLDIPHLDNVINFNFPAKSKLFVHRVGRCARAGRSGTAYSLITPDEYPYLLDLHLFLGRPLSIINPGQDKGNVGRIPQSLLEEQHGTLLTLHENHIDLVSMRKVSENAYKQYVRSRPLASADSNRRIKELPFNNCGIHPVFKVKGEILEEERETFLGRMKDYRPQGTIFEICGKNKSQDYLTMKAKRAFHKDVIASHHNKLEQKKYENFNEEIKTELPESNIEDIKNTFDHIILPKKRKIDDLYKKKVKKQKIKDEENYIPYAASDRHTEEGLAINNFQREASKAQLDLTGDSTDTLRRSKQQMKWDRKKKKMVAVNPDPKAGKIKTESGAWIPATYKSNRYAEWKERTKITENANESDEEDGEIAKKETNRNRQIYTHWAKHNEKIKSKKLKSELKTTEQILKNRKIAEKKKMKQNKRLRRKKKN